MFGFQQLFIGAHVTFDGIKKTSIYIFSVSRWLTTNHWMFSSAAWTSQTWARSLFQRRSSHQFYNIKDHNLLSLKVPHIIEADAPYCYIRNNLELFDTDFFYTVMRDQHHAEIRDVQHNLLATIDCTAISLIDRDLWISKDGEVAKEMCNNIFIIQNVEFSKEQLFVEFYHRKDKNSYIYRSNSVFILQSIHFTSESV